MHAVQQMEKHRPDLVTLLLLNILLVLRGEQFIDYVKAGLKCPSRATIACCGVLSEPSPSV